MGWRVGQGAISRRAQTATRALADLTSQLRIAAVVQAKAGAAATIRFEDNRAGSRSFTRFVAVPLDGAIQVHAGPPIMQGAGDLCMVCSVASSADPIVRAGEHVVVEAGRADRV